MDRGIFFLNDVQYSSIVDNIITSSSRDGIRVENAKHIVINNNNIRNPSSLAPYHSWSGISLSYVSKSLISGNKITDDRAGLKMKWGIKEESSSLGEPSKDNFFVGNWIGAGSCGILFMDGVGSKQSSNFYNELDCNCESIKASDGSCKIE